MRIVAGAGSGFLLAVLWFDLMFDVQVRGYRDAVPPDVLDSIAAYYRRVTTTARPMNRLVAAAMVATLAALIDEVVRGSAHRWASIPSLVLVSTAVALAGARTVRSAVRLGTQTDAREVQSTLARGVFRDHLVCVTAVGAALVLQLVG